ncbi:MAG TPA: DMT family transporter [Burkholderiales bacterium]|nr:DMT family transporter [Burkholderiales bacterium]
MGGLPQRLGVAILMLVASTFAANHIAARLAFDHGTSVAAAVALRSGVTALVLAALMRAKGVSLRLARPTLVRALAIGLLVSVQSFCLYSAVARIPVALALLAFNTYPMLLVLVSWAAGGERPPRRALVAMPAALLGLAFALDVVGSARAIEGRWSEIGAGVGYALTASVSFVAVLFLTTRWLKEVDGRLRTLLTMGVTAVVMLAYGTAQHALALPADRTGWLGVALLTLLYGSAITALFTIVPRLAAASSTVALNFEPVAALLLGWAILAQKVAAHQIIGALVVISAIAFLGSGRRRPP